MTSKGIVETLRNYLREYGHAEFADEAIRDGFLKTKKMQKRSQDVM